VDPFQSPVFLAGFLDQTAGHQILQLFISPQTQHFFATAHRIALLEIFEHTFEKIVETKHFILGKHDDQFVGHMIRKTAREAGSFRLSCHNGAIIAHSDPLRDQKITSIQNFFS